MNYYVTDELYHHGVLGMKWGIRRYQNEDGSLTEAGKKRYAKFERKIEKQEKNIAKWQKKVDNKSGAYLRAEKKKAKAYKLKDKALNGWFISDSKRAKLNIKADRLLAKANKMQNNTIKNEAKIRKAKALINKYNRKLDKLDPNRINRGSQFVSDYLSKRDTFYKYVRDKKGKISKNDFDQLERYLTNDFELANTKNDLKIPLEMEKYMEPIYKKRRQINS